MFYVQGPSPTVLGGIPIWTVGHTIPLPKLSSFHLNKRNESAGPYVTPHRVSSDDCALCLPGAEQLILCEHKPSVIQLRMSLNRNLWEKKIFKVKQVIRESDVL